MTVTDVLTEWSYRCPDGIVDLKDPIKINILNEILKEIGFQETIEEAISLRNQIIKKLIDNSEGKLGIHSRPGRIKNIGNISFDEFQKIAAKTFPEKTIIPLKVNHPENPSSNNPAIKFEDEEIIIILGREAPGLQAEKQQVDKINNFIQSTENKKIDVNINGKIYNNIKLAKLDLKNKHADIILEGDKNVYIQYKDAKEADEFQQYSGIEKFKDRNIVDDFINKIPPSGVEKGTGYKRKIPKDDALYKQGIFGFGNSEGDKVQIVCIGPIKIEKEGKYYTIKGSTDTLIEGDSIPNDYQPYLGARYASDRNQFNHDHTRFGIYPEKYVINFKDVDELKQKEPTLEEMLFSLNTITEELTNSLTELFNTDHFQLRVKERGNVLDILNLNKIPLKDYKLPEVKEKLKDNISRELKERADRILSKDIPSSTTFDIGIKVLKPVLVVDGEKYPLTLFAISTKEIKDKEGNVIEIREVENKGILYFVTVSNNRATTLLLLEKEDDNDLYFHIKQHKEKKQNEREKEAKILTPANFVYEIDLDELMGKEKEKQTSVLIDPASLPYKVRTDYRTGANFDHKTYGTGTIVATSAGSGGKGDSKGKVDWIDVKYPKPFVKGGKLTNIRRFDNILTSISSLLVK